METKLNKTSVKVIIYSLDAIVVILFPVLVVCEVPFAIAM